MMNIIQAVGLEITECWADKLRLDVYATQSCNPSADLGYIELRLGECIPLSFDFNGTHFDLGLYVCYTAFLSLSLLFWYIFDLFVILTGFVSKYHWTLIEHKASTGLMIDN